MSLDNLVDKQVIKIFRFVWSVTLVIFIPREKRGYRFQLVRLSLCPSSRLSVYPASFPGYFSESAQCKVFKLHIRIEHQWMVCKVVFLFDLMKKWESDRIWNMYENVNNILPVSRLYLLKYTLECYYPSIHG